MRIRIPIAQTIAFALAAVALAACGRQPQGASAAQKSESVVIYYSADEVYAGPILEEFEKRTGIDFTPLMKWLLR